MLLKALTIYLLAAFFISGTLLLFRRRLGRLFWPLEAVVLVPFLGLMVYSGIMFFLEISREHKLRNIQFSSEIASRVSLIPQQGINGMLAPGETAMCVINSVDLNWAVAVGFSDALKSLSSDDYPAEDGLWYVMFFNERELTRLYGFESWREKNHCYQ